MSVKFSTKLFGLLFCMAAFGLLGCSGDTIVPDGGDGFTNADGDGGNCAVVCTSTDDCCSGEDCIGGICSASQPCPSGCNYECDKTQNLHCEAMKCVEGLDPPGCSSDCDCYTGETCIANECTVSGGDEAVCTIDDECPGDEVCREGQCRPASCTTREDCTSGGCLVCKNGQCTAPPQVCNGDEDCCVGYRCNFGTCIPVDNNECESDSDCLDDPEFPLCHPTDKVCIHECENDIDCLIAGDVCFEHHCITPGCTPESCAVGKWCDVGSGDCLDGCDSNDDCTGAETCNYVTHQCGLTDCCGGICDPSDQYCDTLSCQCAPFCGDDGDCPEFFTCNTTTGKCLCTEAACPTGTHCELPEGRCVQDNQGTCASDADCDPGFTCDPFTGTCRSQGGLGEGDPCFTDEECDQANGLLCDSSLFCILCMLLNPDHIQTFTCRFECSSLLNNCGAGQDCLYVHLGLTFLCVPVP